MGLVEQEWFAQEEWWQPPHGAAYVAVEVNTLHIRVSLRSWQLPLQALGDDSEVAILLVPSSSFPPPPGETMLELNHAGREPAWAVQVANLPLMGGNFEQEQLKAKTEVVLATHWKHRD